MSAVERALAVLASIDKQAEELREKYALPTAFQITPETLADIRVALERARVVGVLDAWADRHSLPTPTPRPCDDGSFGVAIRMPALQPVSMFVGATPDAARAAAAKAIEAGEV